MVREDSRNISLAEWALGILGGLGWETVDGSHEGEGIGSINLGREFTQQVVLVSRLRAVLERLNPGARSGTIDRAVEKLTTDRSTLQSVVANREVYHMLKDGIGIPFEGRAEGEAPEVIRVIDWKDPNNNDFLAASHLWISNGTYRRQVDLVCFVNGIPFVLFELKAAHKRLRSVYDSEVIGARFVIPQLFWYITAIILSNGGESRIGSSSAPWQRFSGWRNSKDNTETETSSLSQMMGRTCECGRLLDLVESFSLFVEEGISLVRILGSNHQCISVNNSVRSLEHSKEEHGRLGVLLHAPGAGKTYSMIFFSQKVLRKMHSKHTFVIVTDRDELNEQVWRTFQNAGLIEGYHVQATDMGNLERLLAEDHRYIFTLIQQFGTRRGRRHPVLSNRPDVVVIVDEAHQPRYDRYLRNIRAAFPNAAFICLTATPLTSGERNARNVFGNRISLYDVQDSIEDGVTVPLRYEVPMLELMLTSKNFSRIANLLEKAETDMRYEDKVEQLFAGEYRFVTQERRLEKIANHLVQHFLHREYEGKALVVCIDRASAIRMFDRVQARWKANLERLRIRLGSTKNESERASIRREIYYIIETDMAVVVSQSEKEVEEMRRKGLAILGHRRRIFFQDVKKKFRDAEDPLRIVFVCAAWIGGVDIPCCSTIYLDRPMQNRALLETIARGNRVFGDKSEGLIVDYIGAFRNPRKALSVYGSRAQKCIRRRENSV